MKITVIGGSGFVGTRLIEALDGLPVRNVDKQESGFYPDITTIGDVRDVGRLRELLAGQDVVVLLAAEHRDDVSPSSLYYEVNVGGMRNVLEAMEANGVRRMVFTSSVAVYGLNKREPSEEHPADPFNHYGKSKWEAEQVLQEWYVGHPGWNINIIRPTVIFGERNRGNVYNLLRQIASGRFMMVGSGENCKSMAYVGNVVAFIRWLIENRPEGYNVFNYVDKPDFTTNELVAQASRVLVPISGIPAHRFRGYPFTFLLFNHSYRLTKLQFFS
jgi:nucleoside-diphosphate-sugar epimerase